VAVVTQVPSAFSPSERLHSEGGEFDDAAATPQLPPQSHALAGTPSTPAAAAALPTKPPHVAFPAGDVVSGCTVAPNVRRLNFERTPLYRENERMREREMSEQLARSQRWPGALGAMRSWADSGHRLAAREHRLLRTAALTVLPELALVMHSTTVLATLLVADPPTGLGKGKAWLGGCNAAMAAIAALCSGLLLPWLLRHRSDTELIAAGDLAYGLCVGVLALSPTEVAVRGVIPLMAFGIAVLRSTPVRSCLFHRLFSPRCSLWLEIPLCNTCAATTSRK
jgi:hypothetical protein